MTPSGARRASSVTYRRRRLAALLVLLLGAAAIGWGIRWSLSAVDESSGPQPPAEGDAATEVSSSASADADRTHSGAPRQDEAASSARRSTLVDPAELYPRVSDPSWDADSIHVLVNKLNPLEPVDYEPDDRRVPEVRAVREAQTLRDEAAEALEELFAAAQEDELRLTLTSAYRPYAYQEQLYEQRLAEGGRAEADEYTARPGYSEHQTGLAADVIADDNDECSLGACFGETPEGLWVAEHAHEFGFVIRYPEGAEDVTGYSYEPWHLRYVGEETAEAVAAEGLTLEEFWDQPAAVDYDD